MQYFNVSPFAAHPAANALPRLKVALSEAFYSFVARYGTNTANSDAGETASGDTQKEKAFLPREGVEAWLVKINRALGRGSEFRAAEAIMEPGPEGGLTLEGTDTVQQIGCAHEGYPCGEKHRWRSPVSMFGVIFLSCQVAQSRARPLYASSGLRCDNGMYVCFLDRVGIFSAAPATATSNHRCYSCCY